MKYTIQDFGHITHPCHNPFNITLIFNIAKLQEFHSYFVSVFQQHIRLWKPKKTLAKVQVNTN